MESIRRRFFWCGSADSTKINWVAWNQVLNSKQKGGLGVGSLKAFNLALLAKWWWRFLTTNNPLWKEVICGLHYKGVAPFNLFSVSVNVGRGIWSKIIQLKDEFSNIELPLDSLFMPKLGDGEKISFWNDVWIGDTALARKFPRLFALDVNNLSSIGDKRSLVGWLWNWRRDFRFHAEHVEFQNLSDLIRNVSLSNLRDSWHCVPDPNGIFSVKRIRMVVEDKSLLSGNSCSSWNSWVPIKINILTWRIFLHRLPTMINLRDRGVTLSSLLCAMCGCDEESEHHLFISCSFARSVWIGLSSWCGVGINYLGDLPDLFSATSSCLKGDAKMLQAIILCGLWFIWYARNEKIFRQHSIPSRFVLDFIQAYSFLWINNRRKSGSLNWFKWCGCPLSC